MMTRGSFWMTYVAIGATWPKLNIKCEARLQTFQLSLSLNMARPSRKHSSRLISSLSFAFFLFVALIALCPPAVSAEDKKSEYGTVIGIGTSFFSLSLFSFFL
jgi:hypothetical protein